jgi:signal transduction histidine kinase
MSKNFRTSTGLRLDKTFKQNLVQAIFDFTISMIEVLKPVRNEIGQITNFRILIIHKDLKKFLEKQEFESKSFLEEFPEPITSGLFNKLVAVVEKKEILDEIFEFHEAGKSKWLHFKTKIMEDGIILFREDVTDRVTAENQAHHQKNFSGAIASNTTRYSETEQQLQQNKKFLDNMMNTLPCKIKNTQKHSEENIKRLNQVIVIKNRESEFRNSELNLLANVAGPKYVETFRNVYMLLENIITRDSKYLSNSSKADLRRIQSAFQSLRLTTEEIVNYSTIHSEPVDIQIDLNNTLKILENEWKNQIAETGTTINYDNLPNVLGQPILIMMLFRHLITNAIKFRSRDRKPDILIKSHHVDGINLYNSEFMDNIKFIVVSIIDNGIGFDNKYANDIFSLFFRLHEKGIYKGSGMGLPICKKIMEVHQGFITAESRNFNGASFNCFFPSERIRGIF